MKHKDIEDDTQEYFERVIADWYEDDDALAHPYEANESWQQRYQLLKEWVVESELTDGRLLEVGCGLGLLQNVVDNYVGIDIAASSQQHMKKPFVVCSATTLPFPDNSFDGTWSFWVLEHVTQPEEMLAEMRRITKPGGSIFLVAAYDVETWRSQGIHKRPFSDLTTRQKVTKLTIPIRISIPYKILVNFPRRLRELLAYRWKKKPTQLRYGTLQPNYEKYWDYDADACVSLDSYSTTLYFLSRKDRPYFPKTGTFRSLLQRSQPQAYIVHK